jgi:acetyl-CoA synthetase
LRIASSVGEVTSKDLAEWAVRRLGVTLYDQYGQAELGIPIGNFHAPAFDRPLRSGSIGTVTPGFHALVLDPQGRELPAGANGELAFDVTKSPLFWFAGYYNDEARTAQRFRHGRRYYLTGDLVRMDSDGHFHYLGAIGDVIISEGYAIGHGELEAAIAAHAAEAEAAVVNKPDRLVGEIVKAFVILRPEYTPSRALASALVASIKTRLPPDAYPPEIEFVASLPRTLDGKLHRVALRDGRTEAGSTTELKWLPHGRTRTGVHN